MEGSKLNKRVQGAVRRGGGKAISGARGALQKLHLWQKAGLVLCLVSWIASAVIGMVCGRISRSMIDQNCAARWSPDRECAQVSAFVSGSAGMSDETVQAVYSSFMRTLQEDAIALSETQIENGASLLDVCYCGIGNAEISAGEESVNATMIGVGGDFFNFHPLELMDGYYFSEDEIMQDRVLLDDQTAWRLFGSPHVVGMQVNIGGTPHFISGVFRRPTGRYYKYAGMGNYTVFISYDSLCRYTEAGSPAGGDGSDGMESDMMDARLPEGPAESVSASSDAGVNMKEAVSAGAGPAVTGIPATAAWQPVSIQDSGKTLRDGNEYSVKSAEAEEEEMEGTAGSGTNTEDESSGKETEEEEESDEDLDKLEEGDTSMRGDTGRSVGKDQNDSEVPEKEEVNRGRINCYEVILPDPVSGYALMNVRKCLEEAGVSSDLFTIVENSSRFDTFRLAAMVAQPGVRSMQTAPIRYPYWENVALAWEDTLIPYALLQLFLRYAPILFLLYLLIWYATHKNWTVAGIVGALQDRLYERQSERIYGKPAAEQVTAEEQDLLTGEAEMEENSDPEGTDEEGSEPASEEEPIPDAEADKTDSRKDIETE